HRWRRHPLLQRRGQRSRRQADHHDRGTRYRRHLEQGAASLDHLRRPTMRLLSERHDHGRDGAAEGQAEADRRRYRRRHHQYLPLRHLPAGARSDPRHRQRLRRTNMNKHVSPRMNRRSFVIGSAAVGAGLALGLDLPFGSPAVVRAADGSPEVNAWVAIRPDDTVVIRIARSEMGQCTLTGLAQLVAEELECDWNKVTTEYPTPGQSAARKRAWGDFSTGGSRGIRTSQQYVRRGGAAARVMLVQAAANEWKVPVAECAAASSLV